MSNFPNGLESAKNISENISDIGYVNDSYKLDGTFGINGCVAKSIVEINCYQVNG